jgi:hypothetical protein
MFQLASTLDKAYVSLSSKLSQIDTVEDPLLHKFGAHAREAIDKLNLAVMERLYFHVICSARGFLRAFVKANTNREAYDSVAVEVIR